MSEKYITEYNKKNYKQFKVWLKPDEYIQLDDILKKINMSKADFLRKAINDLVNELWRKE